MKYYTICYPDHNILGQEYTHWETLSEQEILDSYWDYWSSKVAEVNPHHLISKQITKENCINDWCIVHWAERNYWWERMENVQ